MKKITSRIILIASTLSLTSAAFANYQTLKFPSLDVYKMHKLELDGEKKGEAPRFAVPNTVSVDAFKSEGWEQRGENFVWTLRVQATNAVSINLAFEKFKLSQNAKLLISSFDHQDIVRPFTAKDNNQAEELWTPVIMAEDILVELVVPANEMDQNKLVLTKVNQGFRTFAQKTLKSGSCNVDVMCSEGVGWEKEINTVGVISTGGSTFCTGFMVNNANNDKTPFFMTAHHCRIRSNNAASLVVYWNYQNSTCGGNDAKKADFQTGAVHLAESAKSDFALVRLNQQPDPAWNVNYAGWDNSGVDATTAVALHHPSTDEKSISFDYDGTTVTNYLGEDVDRSFTHVRVTDWDVGTTEPGSSGSPLFDQNHRVIGQLHGGYASCSSNTSDWYGRFHISWEGEGSSSTRLKDHLDPNATGVVTTDTI